MGFWEDLLKDLKKEANELQKEENKSFFSNILIIIGLTLPYIYLFAKVSWTAIISLPICIFFIIAMQTENAAKRILTGILYLAIPVIIGSQYGYRDILIVFDIIPAILLVSGHL